MHITIHVNLQGSNTG